MRQPKEPLFSERLAGWLKGSQPKTLASLIRAFGDKSLLIIILLLMLLPATPLPTGGITHVFEVIAMLLCLEIIVGVKAVWLPARWRQLKLGPLANGKAIPIIIKRVQWFEKYSGRRGRAILALPLLTRGLGLIMLCLTLTAFLSPPFSGLDTLPSLGVVVICLGLILEDLWLVLIGIAIGGLGVLLVVGLSKAILSFVHRVF